MLRIAKPSRPGKVCVMIAACIVGLSSSALGANDAGGRLAFTRGGWAGARYVAMGKAAEVVANDVYAIYWNPAGLCELKTQERLSPDELREKVQKGDIKDITEQDLIRFSDEGSSRFFIQLGASAAMLDVSREAGFAGAAFKFFRGVAGVGAYMIQSRGIEARDEVGNLRSDVDYMATAGYLSYGWNTSVASLGFSIKGVQERIADSAYYGGGIDFGTNIDVLPFLRVGFVIQDIGTSVYRRRHGGNFFEKLDFGNPTLRLGVALVNVKDFTLAVSGVKKLEQDEYEINVGVQYDLTSFASIYLGLNDTKFSTGLSLELWKVSVSYAFAFDKINMGYNHLLSMSVVL